MKQVKRLIKISFVLNNKNKKGLAWITYINNRIKQNKNFLFLTTGPTGSGKSWSNLSIGEQLDKGFNIDRVIFKGRDLMKIINNPKEYNIKKGSYILWDEGGVDFGNRDWQSKANKLLNILFETFRHENLIVGFTVPYIDFLDSQLRKLFHAEFPTIKINHKNKTTRLKPVHIQYNSRIGKFYHKRLVRINQNKSLTYIKYWDVKKPSDELIKLYEEKKKKFTRKLNKEIEKELIIIDKKNKVKKTYKHFCHQCQYKWESKKENPSRCPNCQRKTWNFDEY